MIISSAVRYISLPLLAALLICLCPLAVSARLTAEAELNYSSYSMSDDNNNRLSEHSFTQNYSLLYSTNGSILNSRFGKYSLALGYNWSAVDAQATANGVDYSSSVNRGHILFNGELLVDPKELPIRLTAYSRDLTRNSFSTNDLATLNNVFYGNEGRLFTSPTLATGINNGLQIDSGATLVAGVKNGMTNGYNEILRHFPMIMLDYRDQLNRDLHAESPIDTRLSRLAFVSLNKKDNWFHYRYTTYRDNINPLNDYSERQFQLGTVDQNLARRWIDFSNWLQVSADIQLTKRTNGELSQNFEESDLNLFFQAKRRSWEARSYNNFNRYRDYNDKLTYRTTVPLYVSGVLNPEVSWSTRAQYRETHDNKGAYLESMLAGYRVEAFRRSPFTLSHNFDLESATSESSDKLVLSGSLETTSTPAFSRKVTLAASYSIKNSDQRRFQNESNFLEQKLAFRSSYTPSHQLRFNFQQTNDFTSGNNTDFSSSVRDSNTALPQYIAPRYGSTNDPGASSYRSLTSLSVAWNPMPRLNLGLTVSEDIYSSENYGDSTITTVSATAGYDTAAFRFHNSLTYTDGSVLIGSDTSSLSNTTTIQYRHSRNLDARLLLAYNRAVDGSITSNSYDVEQRLDYSLFSSSGASRKLLEINEMIAYSSSPGLSNTQFSTIGIANDVTSYNRTAYSGYNKSRTSFTLGFKYYPLRTLILSAGARYQYDNKISNYSLLWYSSAAVNFRLFQASLEYYQGKRQSDGLVEKKFTANVKKTF